MSQSNHCGMETIEGKPRAMEYLARLNRTIVEWKHLSAKKPSLTLLSSQSNHCGMETLSGD